MKRRWFESAYAFRIRKANAECEELQYKTRVRRMDTIKSIADRAMKTAHPNGEVFPVRKTVVVKYEDLLRIWNQADLAKWD